jgi:hypothetical protein
MLSADLGHCLPHLRQRKDANNLLLAEVAFAHGLLSLPISTILSAVSHIL